MKAAGTPDDPARYDHPVTMLYLDSDGLVLAHYCHAGNRPRMVARTSPDGQTVEFDFLDVAGSTEYEHEDWTFMMTGDKPVNAHFNLTRTK
jgi:hypothetical protein